MVHFGPEHGTLEAQVVGRRAIGPNWEEGPLLVEEYDSTTVVPPGARVRRILWDVLEIELRAAGGAR